MPIPLPVLGVFWEAFFFGYQCLQFDYSLHVSTVLFCLWCLLLEIFNTGVDETVDHTIVNELFMHNGDIFIKEDFDEKGDIIYALPSLNND